MRNIKFFKKNTQFIFFLILALIIILIAIFAPQIAPRDPFEAIMADTLKAPSKEYPFGTDILGRDLLSRIIYGTRYSLFMTLTLIFTVLIVGKIGRASCRERVYVLV